jgi:UDP-3-O-[3-hydroxymyristoyl] N-acetylglucosamine deacetylase / 3-hydroxyacyl-[acyl-carrier-protein] dehydratase
LTDQSKPFVDVLLAAGILSQDEPKTYFEPDGPINYSEPSRGVDLICLPHEDFRVTYMVDYKNPALGTQYTTLSSLGDEYASDYAPARTFCFLSEVEFLYKEGLDQGRIARQCAGHLRQRQVTGRCRTDP